MRNADPAQTTNLAAYQARLIELQCETRAATLAGRILEMFRSRFRFRHAGHALICVRFEASLSARRQPRDGRGRFLGRAWLLQAETYSAADLAWFRSSVSSTESK